MDRKFHENRELRIEIDEVKKDSFSPEFLRAMFRKHSKREEDLRLDIQNAENYI